MCLTGRKKQNAESVDTAARHSLCTEGNDGLINSATKKKDAKYTYSEHQEKGKLLFHVFSTVHHSIELFHVPTLMYNSLFINNMHVTLLSSTCFEH